MAPRRRLWLPAFVLSLALSTVSVAAPGLKLRTDRFEDGVTPPVGQWIDLVATVTPEEGAPLPLEGLRLSAEGEAEFGVAIFPPPEDGGAFSRPFDVRLPVKFAAKGKQTVRVRLSGSGAGVEAEARVSPWGAFDGRVTATARLKESPARVGMAGAILVDLSVEPPYHVYGAQSGEGIPLTAELLPGGPERRWVGGGRVMLDGDHRDGSVTLEIPFTPALAGRLSTRVLLFWQPCTDTICDPNEVAYLPVEFDVEAGGAAPPTAGDGGGARGGTAGASSGASGRPDGLEKKSLLGLIVASILGALVALAMPCTYPLIPITISFFTKQAEARHGKVMPLALAYGAGIVLVFAAIGFLVGSATFGAQNVLNFATNWFVNSLFALLFLLFGLSLVGLYEIRLPSFLNDIGAKASGTGGYLSVLAMGTTLVITSFTCTAPVVGALLVWGSRTGEVAILTGMMAVFGLTMAIPFVLLSLSPQAIANMPRSGIWMKHLKVTLGIVELGLVLKFLSNVDLALGTFLIDRTVFLLLWAASFLAAGLYLLAASGALTRGRALAAGFLLVVTGYLGSGLFGNNLPLLNLEAFLPNFGNYAYATAFPEVVTEDYPRGVAVAKSKGLPILLHFTGFT